MLKLPTQFVLLASLFCALSAKAETNLAGVDIELIDEQPSARTTQPVQSQTGKPQQNKAQTALAIDSIMELAESADAEDTDSPEEDIWLRIRDHYALPEVQSDLTAHHEAWYAARPDYVKRMTERSQKYLFYIVEEVEKRGMPSEIALLPMVESAYNPQAYSRSRASGIWQFIPSTGKDFGLKQNYWVDHRRDVTAATKAALDYLQKLHGMFGAWDLALAAYNAGEGNVQRAIDRNQRAGLPTDYKNLNLPEETRNYVPKLQAIKNIVTNPAQYGLEIQPIPNRAYFTQVAAPKQIDTKLAAKLAEISNEEFIALNPGYNRPILTSNGEVHHLLLPTWAADKFAENLASYNKPLSNWQVYYAKRGERMDKIASKFGLNIAQLREVNNLPHRNKFRYPQTLLVPGHGSTPLTDYVMTVAAPEQEKASGRHIKHAKFVNKSARAKSQRHMRAFYKASMSAKRFSSKRFSAKKSTSYRSKSRRKKLR